MRESTTPSQPLPILLLLGLLELLAQAGCGDAGKDTCQLYCEARADCEEAEGEDWQTSYDQCDGGFSTLRSTSGNAAVASAWEAALEDCEELLAEWEECD